MTNAYLIENPQEQARRVRNARLTLELCAKVKPGETVTILGGWRERTRGGPNRLECYAFAQAARELGAFPMIIDIDDYMQMEHYKQGGGFPAVQEALKHSDVVIGHHLRYLQLGLGEKGSGDVYLTGEGRWYNFQPFMEQWDGDPAAIARIEPVTRHLLEKMRTGKTFRVTSPAGTDFSFQVLNAMPILGIVPNYGEVACMPRFGSGNGVVVVDGPTQLNVRPEGETDRIPLRVTFKDGEAVAWEGDPEQVARLEAFMADDNPPGKFVDEVGIPTTRAEANNICWADGTHNCNTLHIAIGNNSLRSDIVHGRLHMDMEIIDPTLYVDGEIVLAGRELYL